MALGSEFNTENQIFESSELTKRTPAVHLPSRLLGFRVSRRHPVPLDLAVDIVQEADALYRTGCQNGKNNALYDSVPTIGFGTALHMHKVNDLRILEYTDEEGRTLYVSAMEKPYGWGNPYETFNAALVEAIALSASPGLTCAGALINRMIGLK